MIKNFYTNRYALLLVAVAIGGVSFYADFLQYNQYWFQRSGSIITVIGAVLSVRKLLRQGLKEAIKSDYIVGGGNASFDHMEMELESERNIKSAYLGIFMIILGTLIWGYGDLLFKLR